MELWPLKGRDVDIRKEIKDLLEGTTFSPQRGHWILLRRTDLAQKCDCLKMSMRSGKYRSVPDPSCKICGGMGYLYDDELHLARKVVVSPASVEEQLTDVGILQVPIVTYYMQYYVHPQEKDEIIEIKLTPEGDVIRPFERLDYFSIEISEPLMDVGGRIEYYRCSVKKKDL